jgi:hypothetical protein
LIQHQLDGLSRPTDPKLNLAGALHVLDHAIELDFGPRGIGGAPTSINPDGYYEIDLDLQGNGTYQKQFFYRLLGDVNGDHAVDNLDASAVQATLGQAGSNLPTDVDGSGLVEKTDRTLAEKSKGRKLAPGLTLNG